VAIASMFGNFVRNFKVSAPRRRRFMPSSSPR
jgi:hypothetical protein